MPFWLLFTSIITLIIGYSYYDSFRHNSYLKKISSKRGYISKEEFINYFTIIGFEEKWIEKLYNHILIYVPSKGFTISPQDNIIEDYRIVDEDFEDLVFTLYRERNGVEITQKEIDVHSQFVKNPGSIESILALISKKYEKAH